MRRRFVSVRKDLLMTVRHRATASSRRRWLGMAMSAPMVTEPAAARVKERLEEKKDKEQQAATDWMELRAAATCIEGERLLHSLQYGELNGTKLKTLVSFVFKARKVKGVAEHNANKDKAVAFLSGLAPGEMQQLLSRTQPGVPATLLLGGPVATATRVVERVEQPRQSPRLLLL